MPKKPILARRQYYSRLRDGSIRWIDWNVVDTSIGTMVEPRMVFSLDPSNVEDLDIYDASVTSIHEIDENKFFSQFGTAGLQVPVDYHHA